MNLVINPHLPLPITVDEITCSWLSAALQKKAPGVNVESFAILDINHGTCTKIRISLEMDEEGKRAGIPSTVIIKGGFEDHSRDMYPTIEKEVYAYRDLYQTLALQTPHCYFAENDPDRQQGIVIIEDLVARNVQFCHALKPQTYNAVKNRLSSLAKFHASSWDHPALNAGGDWAWTKDMLDESCVYMKQYLEPVSWQRFTESPRGAAASTWFHDMKWMKDALDRLAKLGQGLPRCILHGDTHLGNLYLDPDGTPGYFDPGSLRGPAMVEVTYHIGCALDPMDRRKWEAAMLQHYLDELAHYGITPPSFDQAMRQYAAFLVLGYCIFLINKPFFQPEAINTAYTARFSAAMIDNHTLEVLAAID